MFLEEICEPKLYKGCLSVRKGLYWLNNVKFPHFKGEVKN